MGQGQYSKVINQYIKLIGNERECVRGYNIIVSLSHTLSNCQIVYEEINSIPWKIITRLPRKEANDAVN